MFLGPLAPQNLNSAISDFRQARNRAILKEIIARFTGDSIELLSYEEVRKKLIPLGSADRGLHEIPLDAIVGSLGRYTDFTRDFLPRQETDEYRWARVRNATTEMVGLPPIEVYKIGEAYFVKDGNHRVSVARQMGAKAIQGYVTEVHTRVPLTPDVQPDDLILKAEYGVFLENTHLDELRPDADLSVTIPGQYPVLEEHIAVHRHYLGNEQQREVSYDEAVTSWYDTVYTPAIESIREMGILRSFPDRTEADLYLWLAEHRAALESDLGWQIKTETAASDLLNQYHPEQGPLIARIGGKILDVLTLGKLDDGPAPGKWREKTLALHRDDQLFTEILVPVSGSESGWFALDQAIIFAQREHARLLGLHVVADEAQKQDTAVQQLQEEFARRCAERSVVGSLAITSGEIISRQISTQARLADLVITTLLYPPPSSPRARLDSGFRDLIQRCPRPVLAVPQRVSPLQHALLAYDGSPKSEEALFVATYLAGRWQIPLTVITVFDENRIAPETLMRARMYLQDHMVQAHYVAEQGPVSDAILKTAQNHQVDLIIMGGYGLNAVMEVVLGSSVDQVLREADQPVLICR